MSMGIINPGNWQYTNSGYMIPDTRIASLESNGCLLIYSDLNGNLYTTDGNEVKSLNKNSKLLNLYSEASNVYAVFEDGSAVVWKPYEMQYTEVLISEN